MKLKKAMSEFLSRTNSNEDNKSQFVDLVPIDTADPDGHYTSALNFALDSDRILNIALTGPFGSGKSSIIRTFEKKSDYKFLNISLASFKEDTSADTTDPQNMLIEKSILQQMLYGADSSKLPYSRFKRISTPDQPQVKSFLLVFWALATAYLYLHKAQFLSMEIFKDLFWIPITLISFVLAIPVILLSDIYKSCFGISFKKISIKNAEIETGAATEESILNRHLDEIIYFFQSTEYDVVVIEDLDRFGSPEIFVKLREINKLINDNEKTSGKIKFLYALKDDMFINKSRTKFFDFIIPVVPIINSSNSLDMMQERLKGKLLVDNIDQQFLREVSLYIDDLRVINNVFNEFIVYNAKLKSDSLNLTKLLAMMIYKNVYPGDFEDLHFGKGALFEVSRLRADLITETKIKLSKEISDIKEEIIDSTNEPANSVEELIKIFVGHIVSTVGQPVHGIYTNGKLLPFAQLINWDSFESLFQTSNILIAVPQYGYQNQYQQIPLGKSFSQIESEVCSSQTLAQRKKNIENKATSKRVELQSKIQRLEKEKSAISQMALHELLQKNDVSVEEILSKSGIEDARLMVYLIKNGQLDENYHLYTSNFHEGRLTKNDRDFLLAIRNFQNPDPQQPINTPDEVCKNMRPEDFSHKYVLNVTLIDFLLEDKVKRQENINSAVNYISSNFIETEEFFTAYWDVAKNVSDFISVISEKWPGYGAAAVKSRQTPDHLALILSYVDPKYVAGKMNQQDIISDYLSEHGHLVFASDISSPNNFTVLKDLKVKFKNLSSLLKNKALLDFVHKECLFEINPENIGFLLYSYPSFNVSTHHDPTTDNYSAISFSGSEELRKYIDANLSHYIDTVFLALPNNVKESPGIVRQLINADTINNDQKQKIISKQEMIFENLDGIPTDLWEYILSNEKVHISWQNISVYLKCEQCEKTVVTDLLNRQHIADSLSAQCIEIDELGDADSDFLSSFIVENDQIKDAEYIKLIKCLPYSYHDFPKAISQVKTQFLAKTGTIQLTEESFHSANNNELLLSLLIGSNVDEYLSNKEKYPIADTVREKLLSFEMSKEQRKLICQDVTPSGVKASKKLSQYIADVIKLPEVDLSLFNNEVIGSAIVNAQNIDDAIQIFIKCIPAWAAAMTMDVLGQLPEPFSEITEYGKSPKLPKTLTNIQFAKLLETNKIISSVTEKESHIKINTFKTFA